MTDQSLQATILVDQTPEQAFAAINDVRAWWTGNIEGRTDELGAEFTYRYPDIHYSKQKITELVPGKRIVWTVVDSSLEFIENKQEWNGTKITFEIEPKGKKTQVKFTHVGLEPDHECFDRCSSAWGGYVTGNLKRLIESR